jgi:hypothetical protein
VAGGGGGGVHFPFSTGKLMYGRTAEMWSSRREDLLGACAYALSSSDTGKYEKRALALFGASGPFAIKEPSLQTTS